MLSIEFQVMNSLSIYHYPTSTESAFFLDILHLLDSGIQPLPSSVKKNGVEGFENRQFL